MRTAVWALFQAFVREGFLRKAETGSGNMSGFNVVMNTNVISDESLSHSELCSSTPKIAHFVCSLL